MKLTEMQTDALRELSNIGISSASTQLSDLLSDEVIINVPDVALVTPSEVPEMTRFSDEKMGIVIQEMSGEMKGRANLVFLSDEGKVLVHAFLDSLPPIDDGEVDTGYYEREALEEIGNIVISSCISEFADQLSGEVELSVPRFTEGLFSEIFEGINRDEAVVLVIRTSLLIAQRNIKGMVVILLTLDSTEKLLRSLSEFMDSRNLDLKI